MRPYIGVILYLIFILWEILLLIQYIKMIRTKVYRPKVKEISKENPQKVAYFPDEIAHMLSIEKDNYFSQSIAKVNSVLLLMLLQKNAIHIEREKNGKANQLQIHKKSKEELRANELELLYMFQKEAEKRRPVPLTVKDMNHKVFSYTKVRKEAKEVNERLNENLKKKKLLNKTAFETIDQISREVFLNFVLLFVIYGITYWSFIPTITGMLIAAIFTICNMGLGFWAKKRISRYTKKGMTELAEIKAFGEEVLQNMKTAKPEEQYRMVEEFFPFVYALGREKEMLGEIKTEVPKRKYPLTYLLKQTNFLKEIRKIEKANGFKLRRV